MAERKTRGPNRSKSIWLGRVTKREQEAARRSLRVLPRQLPETRGECENGQRPCPFISCRHHLYLDVSERTGTIKLNHPELEVWEMRESCALDVANRGGLVLEEVGEVMNITRERARQIEARAGRKLFHNLELYKLSKE